MATDDYRPMGMQTPLGDDATLLTAVAGVEELSTPFWYDLEFQAEDDAIDPAAVVGFPVTVRIEASKDETRYFNGVVNELTHVGWADRYTTYRARIVPWLWFLSQTADCRIFQEKSVKEIVEQIFGDLGFKDFQMKLSGSYPKREYCVQYRESDLNFVSRLLEEEGIFYFFKHENGKHTLVLADAPSAYFEIGDSDAAYPDPSHQHGRKNLVTQWRRSYRFRTGKYTHTDYNFKEPSTNLRREQTASRLPFAQAKSFEVYDYHGRHEDPGRGSALAKIRMEQIEAQHDVSEGESTCGTFTPGARFTFSDHRSASEVGKSYALTRVEIEARLEGYVTGMASGFVFQNRFECVPADAPFRPESRAKKPVVKGPQTAVIVGPASERKKDGIHVDEYSRVKAQFHWDREHDRDDEKCCWMRVSQAHAGKGWGYIDIPRVGEEVIVDFIEGDPDRPIITGRVYNGDVTPPFALTEGENAKNKTRRGNTTKTYGAGGFNEMSMDDTPGEEQIRIHGQYNMDTVVENDETHTIHNNRTKQVDVDESTTIGNDRTEKVGNDETMTVVNDQSEEIGNNRTTTVVVDDSLTIGNNRTLTVSNNRDALIGSNDSTTVGASKTLSVGANHSTNVAASQANVVGGSQTNAVGASLNESVGSNRSASVGMVDNQSAGLMTNISAGLTMTLSAGVTLTLAGPGGSITIGPSGIHIKGSMVKIDGNPVLINT